MQLGLKLRSSLEEEQEARGFPAQAETWAQAPEGAKRFLWLLLAGGACPYQAPKAHILKIAPGLMNFLSFTSQNVTISVPCHLWEV